MTESSTQSARNVQSASRVVLLERGQELSAFAEVLDELGLPVTRVETGLPEPEELHEADLVISTAQRLLESAPPHLSTWPTTIVVVQDNSKTLSAHLNRIGASLILSNSVHGRALRLLLLHAIYSGPERRGRQRTPIGYPIRVGSGLFKSKATLLELSLSGARIEMAWMPEVGSDLVIQLDKELTRARPLKISTKVLRRIEKPYDLDRARPEIGLSILNSSDHKNAIRMILDRFPDGTSLAKKRPSVDVEVTTADPSASAPILNRAQWLSKEKRNAEFEKPDEQAGDFAEDATERRAEYRFPYSRRIVALGKEAARVLIGCDLSSQGMRVVSNSSIAVDDVMRVALHCGGQTEPLVVSARTLRNDDLNGLALGFEALGDRDQEHLEKIIAGSGPIRSSQTAESAEMGRSDALYVGEVLSSHPTPEAEPREAHSIENTSLAPRKREVGDGGPLEPGCDEFEFLIETE